jgi:hypothetical protein
MRENVPTYFMDQRRRPAMPNVLAYAVKAFNWEGEAFPGSLDFWLTDSAQAPHFDQAERFVAAKASTPVTFDAFSLAGTLTIESLGLHGVDLQGIEYVSPLGPPLCMILVAGDGSGASLGLFPGDSRFQTVEGPLNIAQQTWTLIGQLTS